MQQLRCRGISNDKECNRLLAEVDKHTDIIRIKCPKCGKMNMLIPAITKQKKVA